MNKKEVRSARYLWYTLLLFMFVLALFYLRKPTLTALVVYEEIPQQKNWTFDNPEDYLYDNSLLNLSANEVKLLPEIITSTWTTEQWNEVSLTSAILHKPGEAPHDKTAEVQNQDREIVNLNKDNSLLDLTFNTPLTNGDVISLYLLAGKTMDVWLCEANSTCEAPGYGSINFNGAAGWYNLTLANLPSPQTTLALDPPRNNFLKVDQVKAYHKEIIPHSSTNITYPSSAEIETLDFPPPNWLRWETFTPLAELNNQNLQYQYSVDSGLTWTLLPENSDLSQINHPQIRLKVIFSSDSQETPVLKSLSLNYITSFCPENWIPAYGECLINDTKIKFYQDTNSCSTTTNLPADNGTSLACDYCLPNWQAINTSCLPSDQLTAWYEDTSECYALTGLASDNLPPANQTHPCDYCTLHNCSDSFSNTFSLIANQTLEIKVNSNLQLVVAGDGNNSFNIIEYSWDIKKAALPALPLDKYFDIQADKEISSLKMIINYTEEEINNKNIEETTLKIYYYNETSQAWEALNSTVDASENYVSVLVSHLSFYALFGEEKKSSETAPPDSGGSSSSGGGSSRSSISPTESPEKEVQEKAETSLKTKAETVPESLSAEKSCDYILEVALPEEISLVKENSYEGEIINKGNCAVQRLNLYLSPELAPLVELSVIYFEDLKEGGKTNFTLIRRTETRAENWLNLLTGSAVFNLAKTTKKVNGSLTIEGFAEEQAVFKKDLPLDINIEALPDFSPLLNPKRMLSAAALILFFGLFLFLFLEKKPPKTYKQTKSP